MKQVIFILVFFMSFQTFGNSNRATFAGGCFWCMESPFEKKMGVNDVISGYSGGEKKNPKYKEVASGKTKHREAIDFIFDAKLISYEQLVEIFFRNINPTDNEGQFNDRGFQYSPAIFFHSNEQKLIVQKIQKRINELNIFKQKIDIPIIAFKNFYRAEEYHQNYYKKNILTKTKYKYYRNASGRDEFIRKYWDKFVVPLYRVDKYLKSYNRKELKKNLTPLQFRVTQEDGTEKPFDNKYWNHDQEGIYVDIVSGEPLFSSADKFKSGTGWPSFTKPIDPKFIEELKDNKLFQERIEVRSRFGNSHLGHVFRDGPAPTGLRYCINSASLKFISKSELEKNGYGAYLEIFN